MKKTLTIVFVVLLVISTVIGGAVVAQKITTDKANQTPTQVATSVTPTQNSTEAQKTESTQTQDLEDDTEEKETNESENISNEQISEQSDISAVGFCYRNMSNPEHCFIEVTN